jgi:hypothetical protein
MTCHYNEAGELIRCPDNKVKTIRDRYCRHCGADLKQPEPITPGLFGKFYDDDGLKYDYLRKIDDGQFPYVDMAGDYWEFFKPGLPDERIVIPDPDDI